MIDKLIGEITEVDGHLYFSGTVLQILNTLSLGPFHRATKPANIGLLRHYSYCIIFLGVSARFDKTIVSAWKIGVSIILCNGTPA